MREHVRITYHGMEPTSASDRAIYERAEKLFQLSNRISSCRVAVEAPHKRHNKGNHYAVHIEIRVPGDVLVVSRDHKDDAAHEDLLVAVRDAFQAAVRMMRHYLQRMHDTRSTAPLQG